MGHTAIADVDAMLLGILRDNLAPEVVAKRDSIRLCTPDKREDASVGICLYDIRRSEEVLAGGMRNLDAEQQGYPSMFINLYYMISAWADGDIKFSVQSEHIILGRILQILHDVPILMSDGMGQVFKMKLELHQLSGEEKSKLSSTPELLNKASLYYKVFPVEIESARTRMVKRVSNVDYNVDKAEE